MRFEPAVVDDIVLDTSSKFFTDVGEWNGIGTVVFSKIGPNEAYKSNGFAKPYFPNFYNYPLKNEIIYIFTLPTSEVQENIFKEAYYYITPLNVWSSQHHNAIPNLYENTQIPESQLRDYQQIETGATRRVTDRSNSTVLGEYFTERTNIKPLKKFEGDVVVEGRVGNSLRLGTTSIKQGNPLNNWSVDGINGQPITILRNGQGIQGQVGFLPAEEEINNDNSSIYLTNGQKIPLKPSSVRDYYSYTKSPIPAQDYRGDQIILNSDRLFFNSKTDSIFLSSPQSINLNSQKTLNVDTEEVSMQAEKILLGSKDAKEPVLYGDLTEDVLLTTITLLEEIVKGCSTANAAGIPIVSLQGLTLLLPQISRLKELAQNLKSETVFIE